MKNFFCSISHRLVSTSLVLASLSFGLNILSGCDRGGAHSAVAHDAEVATPLAAGACVPFDRVVKSVIEPKCKMCHGDGSPNKNWTDYKMASQFGMNIVDKITNTPPKMGGAAMPLVGSLTQEEKDLLKAWVQGGSKQTCAANPADPSAPATTVSPPVVTQTFNVATNCNACHGVDGNGITGDFPNLAGQSLGYIEKQLRDFRSKDRVDPLMSGMAQSLKDPEISELAKHFNSMKSKNAVAAAAPTQTPPDVASCIGCHGSNGVADPSAMPNVPNLAGQKQDYIVKQLLAFKSQARTDPIMQAMTSQLSETQIKSIAKYFSEL